MGVAKNLAEVLLFCYKRLLPLVTSQGTHNEMDFSHWLNGDTDRCHVLKHIQKEKIPANNKRVYIK